MVLPLWVFLLPESQFIDHETHNTHESETLTKHIATTMLPILIDTGKLSTAYYEVLLSVIRMKNANLLQLQLLYFSVKVFNVCSKRRQESSY